jgi:pimeloyl-ACP methyl ester carboxylesterase
MPATVVLLHGLWMTGLELTIMQRRLQDLGYHVVRFRYRMVNCSLNYNMQSLCRFIGQHADDSAELHLVGHSLGGVLALQTLRRYPELPVAKVVCLGSPLVDTRAGRFVERLGEVGRAALGKTLPEAIFREPLVRWEGSQPVGVIAGTRGIGLGRLVTRLPKPHDGMVALIETQLPGITDSCEVNRGHTGLVISRTVVKQCHAFLQTGRFLPPG